MSYICLLHLENAHQNPTMLVAGSIMLQGLHQRKPKFIIADGKFWSCFQGDNRRQGFFQLETSSNYHHSAKNLFEIDGIFIVL